MPLSATVHFRHPVTGVRVVIGLRIRPHTKQTDVMIRRVVVHPWMPAGEQPAEAEEALPHEEEALVAV